MDPKTKELGYRWIYTVKCKSDGTFEQYKARLVAKGYTKTYEIGYEKTFALVAKINMLPTLVGTCNGLMLNLRGDLEEGVYMEIPP
ncbi:Copia protein, partial [Mucuna pruriens]